jgi:hypothetical protein
VDGPSATSAAASEWWPAGRPVALKVGATSSVRYDRATGGVWATRTENWLIGRTVWLPLWLLVATTAALPVYRISTVSIRRFKARRRARENRCPACGYDLTGNVSGVCPECGGAT